MSKLGPSRHISARLGNRPAAILDEIMRRTGWSAGFTIGQALSVFGDLASGMERHAPLVQDMITAAAEALAAEHRAAAARTIARKWTTAMNSNTPPPPAAVRRQVKRASRKADQPAV